MEVGQDEYPKRDRYNEYFINLFTNLSDFDRKKRDLPKRSRPSIQEEPPKILGNPSQFAVFSSVRSAILKRWCNVFLGQLNAVNCEEDEDGFDMLDNPESLIHKTVEIGLKTICTMISETKNSHPHICHQVLMSLLDVLQNYVPEDLSREPPEVLDEIYTMLFHLSCGSSLSTTYDNSQIRSIACSCLVALVLARADITQTFKAVSSLLMLPDAIRNQYIKLPEILLTHQKAVHTIMMGGNRSAYWVVHGVTQESCVDTFYINLACANYGVDLNWKAYSFASDGPYIYLSTSKGILKIGTGYGGTINSKIYLFKDEKELFEIRVELGLIHHKNNLYGRSTMYNNKLFLFCKETLNILSEVVLQLDLPLGSVFFSDGEDLGAICQEKEDGLSLNIYELIDKEDKTIKILKRRRILLNARKTITYSLGWAPYSEPVSPKLIDPKELESSNIENEEIETIVAGQEFSLMKMVSGKVFFSGKSSVLGFKSSWSKTKRWTEYTIARNTKISQIAVGHEGQHAVLITEDGFALFTGIARRGEDGEMPKTRRQPRPIKNKKFSKLDGDVVVYAACNYGSSALVTKAGALYIFGKDNQHSDANGRVKGLEGEVIVQVALGKAHGVAINSKGTVFTFGINNRGQCGRDAAVKEANNDSPVHKKDGKEDDDDDDDLDKMKIICLPGHHIWKQELCRICIRCAYCTGFHDKCKNSSNRGVMPKQVCGCGEGDSGCAVCFICRICADSLAERDRHLPLNILMDKKSKSSNAAHQMLEKKKKIAKDSAHKESSRRTKRSPSPTSSKISDEGANISDIERDSNSRVSCLAPAPLQFDKEVVQISCGLHHTVMLTKSGEVYTFGSNQYGQLGIKDTNFCGSFCRVAVPLSVKIAAGSNHTVVLTNTGDVYTMGANNKSQLGQKRVDNNGDFLFSSIPTPISHLGMARGCRVKWIGASGDETFIKLDQALIDVDKLKSCTITGNRDTLLVLPHKTNSGIKCILISKSSGGCVSFDGPNIVDFERTLAYLDPCYDLVWQFIPEFHIFMAYSIMMTQARYLKESTTKIPTFDHEIDAEDKPVPSISLMSNKIILPKIKDQQATVEHVALHILSCLDTIFYLKSQELPNNDRFDERDSRTRSTKDEYQMVNRFGNLGAGTWSYAAHHVEAIRFMADCDVIIGGFALFGGRGEYTAKIKLFDIGYDGGGEHEGEGEMIAESDDVSYECLSRDKYSIFFDTSVQILANKWYVAWAQILGPSSECGAAGLGTVSVNGYIFRFRTSRKSNNGTDVSAGQIPCLLFKVPRKNSISHKALPICDRIHYLSNSYGKNITREGLQNLKNLLEFSWTTLVSKCIEITSSHLKHKSSNVEKFKYVYKNEDKIAYTCICCLRLLKTYILEVYPANNKLKIDKENDEMVKTICDIRTLFMSILTDDLGNPYSDTFKVPKIIDTILKHCHLIFEELLEVFFPSSTLKWAMLCSLLKNAKNGVCDKNIRLLSAMVASLTSSVSLRQVLPIVSYMNHDDSLQKPKYPLLVEKLTAIMQDEINTSNWQWKDAMNCMLDLIIVPVKKALESPTNICEDDSPIAILTKNCCHLITRIVAELTYSASCSDDMDDFELTWDVLTTPSRFLHFNPANHWHTSRGFPDAICFKVDRPGIRIAGVMVYGGAGVYNYELELLTEKNTKSDHSSQQWRSVDYSKGAFNADSDVVQLSFIRPIRIKENIKYAIRLWNFGGPTRNGEQGSSVVRGPDGTIFTFCPSVLSLNGTNQNRGQIPSILYTRDHTSSYLMTSDTPKVPRSQIIQIIHYIFEKCGKLIHSLRNEFSTDQLRKSAVLQKSLCFTVLIPHTLAHLSHMSDPESCVEILNLIKEFLPHVSAINLALNDKSKKNSNMVTTSNYYIWIESEHPYKPATVINQQVVFPRSVNWMVLEMDPRSGTCQPEDSLTIYIKKSATSNNSAEENTETTVKITEWDWMTYYKFDEQCERNKNSNTSTTYVPITGKMSNGKNCWPHKSMVVPGNELIFSLETATDYLKNENDNRYGFKCLVIGYEDLPKISYQENIFVQLEMELAYIGGMSAASLIDPKSTHPSKDNKASFQSTGLWEANEWFALRSLDDSDLNLVSKGLSLKHPPTIREALSGNLSYKFDDIKQLFLRDFVNCNRDTAGTRLSKWFQTESYVDVKNCRLTLSSNSTGAKCGAVVCVMVILCDQYGEQVQSPGLEVKVIANLSKKTNSPPLPEKIMYQPTVKENMQFQNIIMMKCFQMYSPEEMRMYCNYIENATDQLLVSNQPSGKILASFIPKNSGSYSIQCTLDDVPLEDSLTLEVGEPEEGSVMTNLVPSKSESEPSNIRRFVEEDSSGLRIRTFPSLQSEQIGLIPPGTCVKFDLVNMNADGVWIRLCSESLQYCYRFYVEAEAWCLQYNHHFGKTLLYAEENVTMETLDGTTETQKWLKEMNIDLPQDGKFFRCIEQTVIKSGVDEYARPMGMLQVGEVVSIMENIFHTSSMETWVRLNPKVTAPQTYFDDETEQFWVERSKLESIHFKIDDESELVDEACNIFFHHHESPPEKSEDIKKTKKPTVDKHKNNINQEPKLEELVNTSDVETTPVKKPRTVTEKNILRLKNGNDRSQARRIRPRRSVQNVEKEHHHQAGTQTSPVQEKLNNSKEEIPEHNAPQIPKLKVALTPAVAETQRLVFAAFLWHEGIVADAMACASFLKFYPSLPKHGSPVVTRNTNQQLNTVQRHSSVEVSNTGYLNIQQVTLDSLTKSAMITNANRARGKRIGTSNMAPGEIITEEDLSATSTSLSKDTVSVLPAAFQALLALWNVLIEIYPQDPNLADNSRMISENDVDELKQKCYKQHSKFMKKYAFKKKVPHSGNNDIDICELCMEFVEMPVTEHMTKFHKGCGGISVGMGYNTAGIYSSGWKGNCGTTCEGFIGSGYALCQLCRAKYIKSKGDFVASKPVIMNPNLIAEDKSEKHNSPVNAPSLHEILKQNAQFLLDLASSSKEDDKLETVTENQSSSPPKIIWPPVHDFKCIEVLKDSLPSSSGENDNSISAEDFQSVYNDPISVKERIDIDESEMGVNSTFGSKVHRSVSMGQDVGQTTLFNDTIKRRNKNHTDNMSSGSSLLCHPSPSLMALVGLNADEPINTIDESNPLKIDKDVISHNPIMLFLKKDLKMQTLKHLLIDSMRVGSMKTYGFEALNWLLHNVSQPNCLHDLMWWFVNAMTKYQPLILKDDGTKTTMNTYLQMQRENIESYKLTVNGNNKSWQEGADYIVGSISSKLRDALHTLLQSISDLMPLLPPSSPLLLQAVRCWALEYPSSDHSFLHRSHVFNNISKILSKSEDDMNDDISLGLSTTDLSVKMLCGLNPTRPKLLSCNDITSQCVISVSSRQGMIESLIDASTETFWESGEEDRARPKWIQAVIQYPPHSESYPSFFCVYIDNVRDNNNKVSLLSFMCGPNVEELVQIKDYDATPKTSGWIFCALPYMMTTVVVRCEIRGTDGSVRVRQIRILDQPNPVVHQQLPASVTLQRYTEMETLRVFKLITSQVFGRLIDPDLDESLGSQKSSENNDLKEHMVGILYSNSKLTTLQKQVMAHIVTAIGSEAKHAREIWESGLRCEQSDSSNANTTQHPDDYCFEMLSMVLALSGSRLGRSYLSEHLFLIRDLLCLLHTGTGRVQRQVISVLRRMISEVSPKRMTLALNNTAVSTGVTFIDHLISCVSKSLTVQIKRNAPIIDEMSIMNQRPGNVYTVTMETSLKDLTPELWFLRGTMSHQHARLVLTLLADMKQGKMSVSWSQATQIVMVENIMNLTQLKDEEKTPENSVTSPTLWRALGSLCALDEDQVQIFKIRDWPDSNFSEKYSDEPKEFCSNHDDGETFAIMQCQDCGPLCQECDRFLHLNRKNRNHTRTICKQEESSIRVDLHEGCGRVKLFWMLALVDLRSLRAHIEFRNGTENIQRIDLTSSSKRGISAYFVTGICRFCDTKSNEGILKFGNVCSSEDCQENSRMMCTKVLRCGHACGGISGEKKCLPCLYGCSNGSPTDAMLDEAAANPEITIRLKQDIEDMCMICFSYRLSCAPAIQLSCGHVFHYICVKKVLNARWPGLRVTFSFASCSLCKEKIDHPALLDILEPIRQLEDEVKKKALIRLEYEGLTNSPIIAEKFNGNQIEYAMARFAYYICSKCTKPYYGGDARCDAAAMDFDAAELVCGVCSDIGQMCPKHGADFLEYKCRFCCSVAMFFCLGDTHFCTGCHEDFQRLKKIPIDKLPHCPVAPKSKPIEGTSENCPLHVKHPPTGTEFALGCGMCRNTNTF